MFALLIDLEDLKAGSYDASGSFKPASLGLDESSNLQFYGPLRLDVRVSTTDKLTYYVTGRLNYKARGECRRCLREVREPVESEIRGIYAFPESLEKLAPSREEREAGEIFPLRHGEKIIDLTELVREYLVLEYPLYVLCSEDCKGLCPSCGSNLNLETCNCRSQSRDPRWDKLFDLKREK